MKRSDYSSGGIARRLAVFCCVLPVCTILLPSNCAWAEAAIPESAISEMRKMLAGVDDAKSAVAGRRACKRVIRKGLSLVKKSPEAPNRFVVLAVVLESQQLLLGVDDSDRNRRALLDTCHALARAPDEYAEFRLPADLLLTQVAMARTEEPDKVAEGIAELVSRYEGTRAEAECLMMATMMAKSAGSSTHLKTIRMTLTERFGDMPRVKAFLRERFGMTERMFVFRGDFTRADGAVLRLPIDRLGRPYLACFWSEDIDYLDERLLKIKAVQDKYPDRFEVLSFNLDELPDAGQRTLRRLGLDWIPMKLPGGVENDAYLEYAYVAKTPFSFVAVNEMGYVRGKSNRSTMPTADQDVASILSSREIPIRDPSYFALMQSLLIGDFLVAELPGVEKNTTAPGPGIPEGKLRAIQACFPRPAVRCRLRKADALANYTKADELCKSAIESYPDASDIHLARNRRIVALMGMWKLTGDAKHLDRAVTEAKTALAEDAPAGARVVPHFCIARYAIRKNTGSVLENAENAEDVLSAFIEACGGARAQGVAHAAAVVLALDAGHRNLYLNQRDIIMARFDEDRRTWPVAWFFLGRASTAEIFDADGIYGAGTRSKWNTHDVPYRIFRAKFTTLAEKKISFPAGTEDKHNVVVLVDPAVLSRPPAKVDATGPRSGEFIMVGRTRLYTDGQEATVLRQFIDGLHAAVRDHRHKEIKLILVFLSGDRTLVESVMNWTFAFLTPGIAPS